VGRVRREGRAERSGVGGWERGGMGRRERVEVEGDERTSYSV